MPEETFWNERYKRSHSSYWQGRSDGPGAPRFHELVQILDLQEDFPQEAKKALNFGLVGFACDEGVRRNKGRPGAAEGPQALRRALGKLAVHLNGDVSLFDVGDVVCLDHDMEASQKGLSGVVARMHQEKLRPIVLGGGHETAWGHYQGIVLARPMERVGILNFDAHYDLRPLLPEGQGSSGTPFKQIAKQRMDIGLDFDYTCIGIQEFGNTELLVNTAKELGVTTVTAEELHAGKMERAFTAVEALLDRCDRLYVTICLDVLAACYAPGVSAPQALGITPWQLLPILEYAARSGKVISLDVVELAPPLDSDGRTADLAAQIIARYIHASTPPPAT